MSTAKKRSADSVFDLVVIGAGPAGQKAAVQAAKAGARVAVVEQGRRLGGECVHRGTIPSKSLREAALRFSEVARHVDLSQLLGRQTEIAALLGQVGGVIDAHVSYQTEQLRRNGVTVVHGRGRAVGPHSVDVVTVDGKRRQLVAENAIVVATGSRPRTPPEIPIDHEHVLDSDSILSMVWLPKSLTVLGAGVIASEYASIFACLGVEVTMIDRGSRPVGFMDEALSERFRRAFERSGGTYVSEARIASVEWNGFDAVETTLEDGRTFESEKLLCALGRTANLRGLDVDGLGIELSRRRCVVVDDCYRTSVPSIYAVGDVIGFPALAATSMEQGRRAACHALGIDAGRDVSTVPVGIYTIPEMASVGLDEREARDAHGDVWVGQARFSEIARAHITGDTDGLLKMVIAPDGRTVLGVQAIGRSATELVTIGQVGILKGMTVEEFVDTVFNFPTMGEAYRVAALDIMEQRTERIRAVA